MHGTRPFLTLFDVEGDTLSRPQRLEAGAFDARLVEENLPAILRRNESKTLVSHHSFDLTPYHHKIFLIIGDRLAPPRLLLTGTFKLIRAQPAAIPRAAFGIAFAVAPLPRLRF
jgi:hypothetical protein